MKSHAIILVSLIALDVLTASAAQSSRVIYSSSRQFVVGGGVLAAPVTNSPLVSLDANILAVSCERIKQAVLRELAMIDLWRGRIYVVIDPLMTNNQPPVVGAKAYTDGWQYRLEVPRQIDKLKLVRAVVQAVLIEIANRNAGLRSAEIPLWLSEGLSRHLVNSAELDLVLSPPQWTINNVNLNWQARQAIRRDPLKDVRERLRTHAAFSFGKLGDPFPDQLPEEAWKTYQASAQLFFTELLQLSDGRAALVRMLYLLPHHLNWQTAFLAAFQRQFPRLLDVEKWWAVVLVHFTGLDPMHAWTTAVAIQKLDEVLRPSVLVSASPKDLPRRTRIPLQQIINEWDYLRQRILLKQATAQLLVLRMKMPPEMVALVDEYRSVLDSYLNRRDKAGPGRAPAGLPATRADLLVRDVVKKLHDLDQARAAFGQPKSSDANRSAGAAN
jgi:hypothetical protein